MKITIEPDTEGESDEIAAIYERVHECILAGTKKINLEADDSFSFCVGDPFVLIGKMATMKEILRLKRHESSE